jgi:predicted transcriptional regulator
MEPSLTALGLTELQAATYLYLLKHGASAPPKIARELKMTRSNAYKVLDSLEQLDLVVKTEVKKKFVYRAASPTALSTLVALKRNDVLALEKMTTEAIHNLRSMYDANTTNSITSTKTGKEMMAAAYEAQFEQQSPIYFIKSRSDVPFMGFETMDRLRRLVSGTDIPRYGITPDTVDASRDPKIDASANLERTWIPSDQYMSPVEWSVSGNQLLIHVFEGDGRVIEINDRAVAASFQELWIAMDKALRSGREYKHLPKHAKRTV